MHYTFRHEVVVYHQLPESETGKYHRHRCTFHLEFTIKDQPQRKEFTDLSELPSMEEVVKSLTQVFHSHGQDIIYVFGPTTPTIGIDEKALYIRMNLPVFENIVQHFQDRCDVRLNHLLGKNVQILQSKIDVKVHEESSITYKHHNTAA